MKKQFIFIMTDTTGFNMLGCYGNHHMITPCLDKMAEDGVRFDRVYTTQPVCGPARSSLFTGMFPHSNGSWSNCMGLSQDVETLGEKLSKQNIHCAYIGKWHLDAGDYFGNGVCPNGWDKDYWYDMKNYLDELTEEERVFSRDASASDKNIQEEFTYAHRINKRALDFIEKHQDEDYFLVVSYDEPHDPGLCPPPFNTMYNDYDGEKTPAFYDDLKDKPLLQHLWARGVDEMDKSKVSAVNRRLLRCNSYVDMLIGRILNKIETDAPDALTLFTSDHGDASHAHSLFAKGPAVYDEIARVPLIFKGKNVPKNIVYHHTVSHIDLPATVMDYLTDKVPNRFQGKSLLPQVEGSQAPTNRPAFVTFSRYEVDHDGFGGFQPMRAIITDEYKLAVHLLDTDEMYERKTDPYDVHNLIQDEDKADIRNALHDQIIDFMNDTRDPFRGYQWETRPYRKDKVPSWDGSGFTRQKVAEEGENLQLDYSTGLEMQGATRVKGG